MPVKPEDNGILNPLRATCREQSLASRNRYRLRTPSWAGPAIDSKGRTIWIVDAHRGDGRRFIVRGDEILSAFIELEREVLTVTFYLESIA